MSENMRLVKDVKTLLSTAPDVKEVLGLADFSTFAQMTGALFTSLLDHPALGRVFASVYGADKDLVALSLYDIQETARRNFEPGEQASTFLFSRGAQAIMAHRVAHKLWSDGNENLAQALKSKCGRVFGTDIHPAARIGAGLWLDHGLGFVVGETSVIQEDVSIWHNVTLGSTLSDDGPRRHPHIGRGAVIGAGALLLGGITIGAGANIGAGAIVLEDVNAGSRVLGCKAQSRGKARISFSKSEPL